MLAGSSSHSQNGWNATEQSWLADARTLRPSAIQNLLADKPELTRHTPPLPQPPSRHRGPKSSGACWGAVGSKPRQQEEVCGDGRAAQATAEQLRCEHACLHHSATLPASYTVLQRSLCSVPLCLPQKLQAVAQDAAHPGARSFPGAVRRNACQRLQVMMWNLSSELMGELVDKSTRGPACSLAHQLSPTKLSKQDLPPPCHTPLSHTHLQAGHRALHIAVPGSRAQPGMDSGLGAGQVLDKLMARALAAADTAGAVRDERQTTALAEM